MRVKSAFKKFFFLYALGANLKTRIKLIGQAVLLPILFHLPVIKVGQWMVHDRYQCLSRRKAKTYSLILNEQVVEVKLRTQDLSILYEVFMDHAYHLDIALPKDITLVDLGAHIGLFGLYAKSMIPQFSYFAVEPGKENFSLLQFNTLSLSRKYCLNKAIWRNNIEVGIQENPIGYNNTTSNHHFQKIGSITMDSLLAEVDNGPIGMKIDIEGSESILFEGNTAWIEQVNFLWIEWHENVDRKHCESILLKKGLSPVGRTFHSICVWVR